MTDALITDMMRIAEPFPSPPGGVRRALDVLNHPAPRTRTKNRPITAAHPPQDLARPWDPASCPPALRGAVWTWCEAVAEWINHEYCWRPDTMIPACWPDHPHIARELAVLAIGRWLAEQATDPQLIEIWHRDSYPGFCQRMTQRLGESTCRTGRHIDWPAAARHAAHQQARPDRLQVITDDCGDWHPPQAVRLP